MAAVGAQLRLVVALSCQLQKVEGPRVDPHPGFWRSRSSSQPLLKGMNRVQILGTFVGTLNFEASPDNGTTWYALQGNQVGTSTIATIATSVGAWRFNIAGFTTFRVRLSPVTSGSASITIRVTAEPHNVFLVNASPLGQTVMANSSPVVLPSDQVVATNLKQVNADHGRAVGDDLLRHTVRHVRAGLCE